MRNASGFYTMKGYQLNTGTGMSSAMEDYLEMIMRLVQQKGCVRIRDLSNMLHVKPSSATKMVQQLSLAGYTHSERYGEICLTEKGCETGHYLLYRHDVIHRFLCALNQTTDELDQTEKIEHFLTPGTVNNLSFLINKLEDRNRTI